MFKEEAGGTAQVLFSRGLKYVEGENVKRMMMAALVLCVAPACVLNEQVTTNNPTSNNPTSNNPTTNNPMTNNTPAPGSFTGGTVEEDITLSGNIVLESSVSVQDTAKITIEAGTTIRMCADCKFIVGQFGSGSTIIAEGTSSQPIQFIGEADDEGYWDKIRIESNVTSNSVLSNVVIKNAGGSNYALSLGKNIKLEDVTVDGSGNDGVYLADIKDGSSNLVVKNVKGFPVEIAEPEVFNNFPTNGSYAGNGEEMIKVTADSIESDVTIPKADVPYFLSKSLTIQDAEVTIEAGTTFKMGADTSVLVGRFSTASKLVAEGTSGQPIVFEGLAPEQGYWGEMSFNSTVLASSVLSNVVVRGATNCINADMSLDLIDVTLENCKDFGLVFTSDISLGDKSSNITITGGEGLPAQISAQALTSLPVDGSFSGNADDCIEISRGGVENIEGTVPNPGVPYCVKARLDMQEGARWTIAPGTSFIFDSGTGIIVGRFSTAAELVADASGGDRIEFLSRDDTNGYWPGVEVKATALSTTTFKNVFFEYGGDADDANLTLQREGIEVDGCEFKDSAGSGLHINHRDADAFDYAGINSFSGNTEGDIKDDRL